MKNFGNQVHESVEILQAMEIDTSLHEKIEEVIGLLIDKLKLGGTIFTAGNGGSAADAQHITAELVGKFMLDRAAISSICLNSNVSNLTAWSNDESFDSVFSRQLEASANENDALLVLSTSGNSENVLRAAESAKKIGCTSISLIGASGGKLKSASDHAICVPATSTPRIQEAHICVYHYICERIESELAIG